MTSAKAAIEYYDTHLSQALEGYYVKQQDQVERLGQWFGKTAVMFGLEGQEVDREAFSLLAQGVNPVTGEKLTMRQKDGRRVGTDFSMAVPKSVSVAAMDDERISEALLRVGRTVMGEIEKDMQVRVRANGQNDNRVTGNIIASEHLHTTTRPLKETGKSSPHWHLHYFLFNVSYDNVEKKFKAVELGNVQLDRPYYDAMAHNLMAAELVKLGYKIRRTADAYEIAGISDDIRQRFSGRSVEVKELIDGLGLKSAKAKATAGAYSRSKKQKDFTLGELREYWHGQLTDSECRAIERARLGESDGGAWAPTQRVTATQSVDNSLKHWHESHSTINKRRAMATAILYGVGHVSPQEIAQEFERPDIIHVKVAGEEKVGSREVLKQEQFVIDTAKAGRGSKPRLILGSLNIEPVSDGGKVFELNDDQQQAIRHIAASRDRFVLVEGKAGTGKTTMMKTAVEELVAETGKQVITLAPTARASRGVLRQEGFKDADTLQRFLDNDELMRAAKDNIVWLDEAAIASADDMARLFAAAGKYDFDRVIIQGDPSQHESTKRSAGLFNLLKSHAGIKPVVLDRIMRQTGDYARAAKLLGEGKLAEGFDMLDKLGLIQELPKEELHATAANQAADYIRQGVEVGLSSPVRLVGKQVSSKLRAELKEAGRLGDCERVFTRLENRHLSQAQREMASHYRLGDIVQFMKKVKGFKVGERVRVHAVEGEGVRVQKNDGSMRLLPLDENSAAKFGVYVERQVRFAESDFHRGIRAGDHITLRKDVTDSHGQLLRKDQECVVAAAKDGELTLASGGAIAQIHARKVKRFGDRIKLTANGNSLDGKRLNNGDVVQIDRFTKDGNIQLTDGRVIDQAFGHFELGWAETSYASQGSGYQKHLVVMDSDHFGPVINMRQFYVDATRGKKSRGLTIFTDDKQLLRRAMQRSGGDQSMTLALEQANAARMLHPCQRIHAMHKRAQDALEWIKEKWIALRNHDVSLLRPSLEPLRG
ncbi:MAG: MobF family relaxase [Pirellulaceae bacterium]